MVYKATFSPLVRCWLIVYSYSNPHSLISSILVLISLICIHKQHINMHICLYLVCLWIAIYFFNYLHLRQYMVAYFIPRYTFTTSTSVLLHSTCLYLSILKWQTTPSKSFQARLIILSTNSAYEYQPSLSKISCE